MFEGLPGVQNAQNKYDEPNNALTIPPLQIWGRRDGFFCEEDHHSRLVLDFQRRGCRGGNLLEDAEQTGVAFSV